MSEQKVIVQFSVEAESLDQAQGKIEKHLLRIRKELMAEGIKFEVIR